MKVIRFVAVGALLALRSWYRHGHTLDEQWGNRFITGLLQSESRSPQLD